MLSILADSFLQSESVWMASTNKASDESRRSYGSALLNIGPAGSRPGDKESKDSDI